MTERWRQVVGFEGRYEVSDEGRVASLRYRGNGSRAIMKVTPNYAGYHVVTLGVDRKQFRVHCLVLEAFVGPRPAPEMDGCHDNDNKDQNHLGNLRWDTKLANIAQRDHASGDRHGRTKLSAEQRAEVKRLRVEEQLPLRTIADRFGISDTRVSQLAR